MSSVFFNLFYIFLLPPLFIISIRTAKKLFDFIGISSIFQAFASIILMTCAYSLNHNVPFLPFLPFFLLLYVIVFNDLLFRRISNMSVILLFFMVVALLSKGHFTSPTLTYKDISINFIFAFTILFTLYSLSYRFYGNSLIGGGDIKLFPILYALLDGLSLMVMSGVMWLFFVIMLILRRKLQGFSIPIGGLVTVGFMISIMF